MAKDINEHLNEIYFEQEYNTKKALTYEQKELIKKGYIAATLDSAYQEHITREKLKRKLKECVADGNHYDVEELTEPYIDFDLKEAQITEIQEWSERLLDRAADIAVGVLEDID